MAFERYPELLSRSTGPYRAISAEPEYAKIDQDGMWCTVAINRLTRVAKEGGSNLKITYDSRATTDPKPVKETSIEKEKNYYSVEAIVGHENRPTGTYYAVQW